MKKILQFFLIIVFSTKLFGQLDTEHWFAPMYDGQSNGGSYQYLYLSTNDTTPFTVYIYSNNTLIGQSIISKGNPQYVYIPRQYLIVDFENDWLEVLKVTNKGLNVKGDRRFFANLRFGMVNHAEILTSKGAIGLGKEFYTVMAPNAFSGSMVGASVSFIATEDGTTVTISDLKKDVYFSELGTPTSISVTLNKGQSYIADARSYGGASNSDGFIGAKITADKPISMTNGNFNGQYVVNSAGSDILMDQSVPIENLGNEFGIISGMGVIKGIGDNITNDGMERAVIVATKNNTQIYINNGTMPVKIINEGDYYFVPDTFYSKKSANHYNLYIKTSENVYVYQVLGGVSTSTATGSMNFIPPLSCYLPRKVDEIGYVDKVDPYADANDVKLNIITQLGAKVKINGVEIDPALGYGPYTLDGNTTWETYSVPNIAGNITVESDKAINVGLAGGDRANMGYAGYFAGFSAIPFIVKKEGTCIPDIILELPEGYDSYQWFVRNELTGLPEPIVGATTYLFKPSKSGVYTAEVKGSACLKVTTPEFKLLNCPTTSTLSTSSCNDTISINPVLSSSSQVTDWNSIAVIDPPTQGNLNIDKINKIFDYTPTFGVSGIDTFKYSFCGVSTLPDCEEVKVSVYVNIVAKDDLLFGCKIDATKGQFDLTKANITEDPSIIQKRYYKFQLDADNDTGLNLIPTSDLSSYKSEEGFVYVRLKSSKCARTVKIELKFFPVPELIKNTYEVCDAKLEGEIDVQLDQLTNTFLKDHNYFSNVKYYTNNINTTGVGLPNNWSYSADTVIYMKVESPDGCASVLFPIYFKIGPKVNVDRLAETKEVCDEDFDYKKLVKNLDDFINLFTADTSVTAKFYINKIDAQNNASNNITEVMVNTQQLLYVRLSKTGVCDRLVELTLKIKIPGKSATLRDQEICPEKMTTLDAGAGFFKYDWYNEKNPSTSLSQNQTLEDVGLGEYFVILTAFNNCSYTQKVKITPFELPEISEILIQGKTVTIIAKKGNPPYTYSIDGINYQASNVFTNVPSGSHKAYVISKNDCKPVVAEFSVIEIYNLVTPNGDGYNDVLDMSLLETKIDVKFWIHNRNGSKVFEGDKNNRYIWDGKQYGRPLPASSYWYLLEWKDFIYSAPVKYTGWILLKNRN